MNASLVITLECLVLGGVVNKWSVSLVPLVILPKVNRWYAFDGVV